MSADWPIFDRAGKPAGPGASGSWQWREVVLVQARSAPPDCLPRLWECYKPVVVRLRGGSTGQKELAKEVEAAFRRRFPSPFLRAPAGAVVAAAMAGVAVTLPAPDARPPAPAPESCARALADADALSPPYYGTALTPYEVEGLEAAMVALEACVEAEKDEAG